MPLCLVDLVRLTGGSLRMAAMPPRDGELAAIERIVLAAECASGGDVFWQVAPQPGDIELAFLRGAAGVVAPQAVGEPWPGRFWLQVTDAAAALESVVAGLLAWQGENFFDQRAELKVLQLCAARRTDIYPHTSERHVKRRSLHRCRRKAA
jgi:hypothetical protein